jgi:hypothetical protein
MYKKSIVFTIIVAFLLSVSIHPGNAQEAQPQSSEHPDQVNLAGGAPWVLQIVDGSVSNSVGTFPSVVFNSGSTPYISYYNGENGELWLASRVSIGSGNCGVGNSFNCRMVDTDGDVGKFSSIDYWRSDVILGNWKLGISYYDTTNRALKLAIYSCSPHFACTWSIYTIQQATNINQYYGQYSSFKFTSDGVPGIAYHYSNTAGDDVLKYAYPVTAGGNCGLGDILGEWQCDSIDTGEGMGKYASLSVDWGGTAFIAYYDEANGNLKYTYYAGIGGNCGPANGWLCTTIDGGDGSDVGLYASFVTPRFSGDLFRIAYHDKTNGHLKIAYTLGATGNCDAVGWQCEVVDDTLTSISPMGISMAVDASGTPIIAYQKFDSDLSPGTVAIARPAPALGLTIGNCGDVPPGYLFQYWQCDTIDGASQYTNEAIYVSVALNSSGLAIIAYPESDDYDNFNSLKIAYQTLNKLYLPLTKKAP